MGVWGGNGPPESPPGGGGVGVRTLVRWTVRRTAGLRVANPSPSLGGCFREEGRQDSPGVFPLEMSTRH